MEITNLSLMTRIMKTGFILTTSTLIMSFACAKEGEKTDNPEIYEAIGMMFAEGSGLGKMEFTDEQIDLILAGMKKGIGLKEMPPEIEALMPKVQALMTQKMKIARQVDQVGNKGIAAENKAKAKEYLALLTTDENIKKDPSGFYYEILKKGTGPSPTMKNTVRLHYHGTLINGTVFDSSVDRGQPASFPMGGVIKGFSGGLTKTQVGGKIKIYIPSELGYGDNPRPGGKIKPGDTLIFECELLEIN
jgi:FKBP-type peptidyl-prolyl cis-trans isomerase